MEALDMYMTDYGVVVLDHATVAPIPRRKNGDFDRRFKVSRELIRAIKERAKAEYLSTGDWDTFPIKFVKPAQQPSAASPSE